jgi:hypothetical protein
MYRTIRLGDRGPEVAVAQSRINAISKGASGKPLAVDGIFGPNTQAGARAFQRENALAVDGVVGSQTWSKLLVNLGVPTAACLFCDDVRPGNPTPSFVAAPAANFASAPSAKGVGLVSASFLPSLPTTRSLTSAEETIARSVYGSSIDFSSVLISDKTGLGGRAFVLTIANPFGNAVQIMNVGVAPSRNTLIHELAHVWQSQHHSSSTRYMINAVESQALAEATNLLRGSKSFSAYGYVPGRPFGEYASEQIAQQVMRGEAAIVAHVRSASARAVDPGNVASLSTARIEDTSMPGVKT